MNGSWRARARERDGAIQGHGSSDWWEASGASDDHDSAHDAASLYEKLEQNVVPLYRRNHDAFTEMMRHCIAFNGSFFNTHRMLHQYAQKAYLG